MTQRAADPARITDIDAQIFDIERSILVLRIEKDLVQERLDSYTYPVLTLPIEITSKIFSQFLLLYPHEWRGIALAIPALWRAIYLHLTNSSFRDYADIGDSESDKLYIASGKPQVTMGTMEHSPSTA
ncbi:hypothetical protein K438DRAFT_1968736 [Mycena galopus ATCC 62051]|nr:hypothetical protein K438DRAFT_1968736 [Mycena galopus ATCC 62051]